MIQLEKINIGSGSPSGVDVWEWNSTEPDGAQTIGTGCTATGEYSLAAGQNSSAAGSGSVVFGRGSNAQAAGTVLFGDLNNELSGTDANFVLGQNNDVDGGFCFIGGVQNVVSASTSSNVIGSGNTASNDRANVLGFENDVSGEGSTAIGRGHVITSGRSTAIGIFHNVQGERSLATGRNAKTTMWGEHAHTGGGFNNAPDGSSQSMVVNMLTQSTGNGINATFTLDGIGQYLVMPDNCTWFIKMYIVAKYYQLVISDGSPTDGGFFEFNIGAVQSGGGPLIFGANIIDQAVNGTMTFNLGVNAVGTQIRPFVNVNREDLYRFSARVVITQVLNI